MVFSVNPSKEWLGNDGNWSTFTVVVGTPPQRFQVLPATSLSYTLLVNGSGCEKNAPIDCSTLRGRLLNTEAFLQSRWQKLTSAEGSDTFYLPFPATQLALESHIECDLGVTNTVSLDWSGSSVNSGDLQNQLVAGFAATQPFLGLFGLSYWSSWPADDATWYPSPLQELVNMSVVSSATWGYTAGARYRSEEARGSLTFGGYDSSRVNMSEALSDIPFTNRTGQELMLTISKVTFGASDYPEMHSVNVESVVLDSSIPDIWLPDDICSMFENQYGLQWDSEHEIYLITEAQHENLTRSNIPVSFSLAVDGRPSETITIELPYSAFDHTIQWPLANITDNTTSYHYFPLKKSGENALNFLGRTFFQEA